jgi:hypothetical protein
MGGFLFYQEIPLELSAKLQNHRRKKLEKNKPRFMALGNSIAGRSIVYGFIGQGIIIDS